MSKTLETPCLAPSRGLSSEFKYDFALGGWTSFSKASLYSAREKYGAVAALELHKRHCEIDDFVKNLITTIQTIFNLKGYDTVTIGEVLDVWDELTGIESTILERSKTINRRKITKCLWKTDPIDVSDWNLAFMNILTKAINPEVTFERPKAMCAGDPYCEYVWKLGVSTELPKGEEKITLQLQTPCAAPKRGISWDLKYNFAMKGFADFNRGWLYAVREKYGPAAALEIFDMSCKFDNATKGLVQTFQTILKIEGNDCVTIGEVLDVWDEISGYEGNVILERSPTINRRKVVRCPWLVKYHDIGNYAWYFKDIMGKTVNPKATLEMPKKMCAGDPYCDYIWRIEE